MKVTRCDWYYGKSGVPDFKLCSRCPENSLCPGMRMNPDNYKGVKCKKCPIAQKIIQMGMDIKDLRDTIKILRGVNRLYKRDRCIGYCSERNMKGGV
jgi:hypothetical protein